MKYACNDIEKIDADLYFTTNYLANDVINLEQQKSINFIKKNDMCHYF